MQYKSMRFVALAGTSGLSDPSVKEIGELSEEELQRLSPSCREHVRKILQGRELPEQNYKEPGLPS